MEPSSHPAGVDVYSVPFWDGMYQSGRYSDEWCDGNYSPELVEHLMSQAWPVGTRAVDIGCGTGADVRYLASIGFEAVGVDISEIGLQLAHGEVDVPMLFDPRRFRIERIEHFAMEMTDEHADVPALAVSIVRH